MKDKNLLKNTPRSYGLLFSLVLAVGLSGCAATTLPMNDFTGALNLKGLCEKHNIQWGLDSISQVVTLQGAGLKARALVGSDVVMVGSDKVFLSSPVRRSRSDILVPVDFERKIINQLKTSADFSVKKFRKVIVDAGHGGKDPGAIGRSGMYEKTVNLDVAERLKRKLEAQGIDVIMTRKTDKFLTLEERTEIASRSDADLFVSVHANSNPSRSVNGLEVYYFGDLLLKDKKEEQRLKNKKILYKHLSMKHNSVDVQKIVTDMLHSYKQSESSSLAKHVSQKMARSVGMKNRGSLEARYFVLRNTFIPAILVEVGYLSHTREERLLKTSEYRDKVANAIARSILNYAK